MKENRKGLVIAIIVLLIGASVVTVVGGVSYRMNTTMPEDTVERTSQMDLWQYLYVTVTTNKNQYYIGETVKVTIDVTNIGSENVTVCFPSAHIADFKVLNHSSLIYLWSHYKIFIQIVTYVTIPAGQSVNLLTDYWDQVYFNGDQVPCGGYRIDGYMMCYCIDDTKYPEIHGNTVYITIREPYHDVGVKEITEPSWPYEPPWPTGEYGVEAVVKNYGTFNETDFNVNAKIWALSEDDDDELYYEDDYLVTTNMSPGDEITVVFTDVDFPGICNLREYIVTYRMEVTTELSGDEVSDNDQKTMFFAISYIGLVPYLILNGTFGENDWYISCVTITFEDRYPPAGYVTYFKLNDGEWQVYDEPFIVCEDGMYMLYYYFVDRYGNMELGDEAKFKIDQTPPTIEDLIIEKIGINTWLFTADVYDETSGVARVEFYVNGDPVGTVTTAPYEWKVTNPKRGDKAQAIVYDNAGNDAVSKEVTVQSNSQSQSSSVTPIQRSMINMQRR